MRVLFIGPPLYGLLYPILSLAQGFRAQGHEVVIASAGKFAQKAAEAGLVTFDAAPELDSEAQYQDREEIRKKNNIVGNFSFFGNEMADRLIEFAGHWRPDLIVYPPLGVLGPLIGAKFGIPVVMQTVGFAHTPLHINVDSAHEADAEIILHLSLNSRAALRKLPTNVRLVDWIPMGVFLNGADGFIHHGGAGNTLTALHSGIPQIVFGQGADRPVNARAVVDRGCGIIPEEDGLTTQMINAFLNNGALRTASAQIAAEMATQATPAEVAAMLVTRLKKG